MTPQMGQTEQTKLADYLALFASLTPDRLDAFDALTTEDVRLCDPFSDVAGRAGLKRVLAKMFSDVAAPRFVILAVAGEGATWYVRWRFEAKTGKGGAFTIDGVSEIVLAPCGRIAQHMDFWDAGRNVYERLPILGGLIRRIRRRIGVNGEGR